MCVMCIYIYIYTHIHIHMYDLLRGSLLIRVCNRQHSLQHATHTTDYITR